MSGVRGVRGGLRTSETLLQLKFLLELEPHLAVSGHTTITPPGCVASETAGDAVWDRPLGGGGGGGRGG